MEPIKADKGLVAHCGLYCGSCGKLLKGSCPGCSKNEKATWCKIRACCADAAIASCAEFKDPMACKKFNNILSKAFGLLFRSDRAACIAMIREKGYDGFAAHMSELRQHTIKR